MEEYIKKYKLLGLNYYQIEEVKEGFKNGLTIEQVDYYAKPIFDHLQMEELRLAFQDGFTYEQVDSFGKPEFNHEAMNHARIKLKNSNLIDEKASADLSTKRIKNLILFAILSIIFIVLILISIFAKTEITLYFQKLDIVLTDKKITLNYGEPFNAFNYVKSFTEGNNIEIILPEDVNTNLLGIQKVLYKIKNPKKVITKTLELEIIDTIKAEIVLKTNEVYNDKFYQGCRYYIESAFDNVDGNVYEKVNCYEDENQITYTYTDTSSNNTTEIINFKSVPKCDANAIWDGSNCVCNAGYTGNGYSCAITKPQIIEKPVYVEKIVEVPSNNNSSSSIGGGGTYDSGWIYETIEGIDNSGNAIVKWE